MFWAPGQDTRSRPRPGARSTWNTRRERTVSRRGVPFHLETLCRIRPHTRACARSSLRANVHVGACRRRVASPPGAFTPIPHARAVTLGQPRPQPHPSRPRANVRAHAPLPLPHACPSKVRARRGWGTAYMSLSLFTPLVTRGTKSERVWTFSAADPHPGVLQNARVKFSAQDWTCTIMSAKFTEWDSKRASSCGRSMTNIRSRRLG